MSDDLYTTDFYSWTQEQAKLLRSGRIDSIDVAHIIEEIEALGRLERASLKSAYRLICSHLLKMMFQPDKYTRIWYNTIDRERSEAVEILDENPGLRPNREEVFAKAYALGRRDATRETRLPLRTFPEQPPFTLEDCESTSFVPSEHEPVVGYGDGAEIAPAPPIAPELDAVLKHLSARYCWDSTPDRATAEADRVILRTFNVGTWEDTLELERVAGPATLRATLSRASAGALTPRAWSFWHYRLGLVDVDGSPPPQPARMPR